MQELLSHLRGLNNWETLGYFLLPKDQGHLVEVIDNVNSCRTDGNVMKLVAIT